MKIYKDILYNKKIIEIEGDIPLDILKYKAQLIKPHSELTFADKYVIKRSQSQKILDYIRRIYNSQAKREYFATLKINNIGIKTAKVYGYAIYLNPFNKLDSILLMERVENIGTMADILLEDIYNSKREIILKNFKRDLKTFINNGIYHKDTNFSNILINKKYETIWIDNDISTLKGDKERKKFLNKLMKKGFLSNKEKEEISHLILDYR